MYIPCNKVRSKTRNGNFITKNCTPANFQLKTGSFGNRKTYSSSHLFTATYTTASPRVTLFNAQQIKFKCWWMQARQAIVTSLPNNQPDSCRPFFTCVVLQRTRRQWKIDTIQIFKQPRLIHDKSIFFKWKRQPLHSGNTTAFFKKTLTVPNLTTWDLISQEVIAKKRRENKIDKTWFAKKIYSSSGKNTFLLFLASCSSSALK